MLKRVVAHIGDRPVILVDSITQMKPEDAGAIAVSASHGGVSSARFALAQPLTCAIFSDAGIGKDRAGVAGLALLDDEGIPGIAVSHESARIGDAKDIWENGRVSFVNAAAAGAGVCVGEPVKSAVQHFG